MLYDYHRFSRNIPSIIVWNIVIRNGKNFRFLTMSEASFANELEETTLLEKSALLENTRFIYFSSKGVVIINSGHRGEGICPGYQNLWLYFTKLWKLLLGFYRAPKTFRQKSLKVWGNKTCTYDKQKLTKKL